MRTDSGASPQYVGRRLWSAEQAAIEAGQHGMETADLADLPAAHALSESLMQTRLAPLWALASAHMHTHGSAWVYRECGAITGVWLCLPLTWSGEASLRTGRFAYAAPRLDDICRPGDEMSAIYMWFAGGATPDARRAIMRSSATWFDGVLSRMRIYARAASEEGARALSRFAFQRLAPDISDLLILNLERGAAA